MNKPLKTLYIELTNLCNCSCLTCPQSIYEIDVPGRNNFNRAKGFMDMLLFKKVIDQSYELTSSINFSYFGEHTLHPHFNKAMSTLKDRPKGIQVRLFTNFLMVNEGHINSIIDAKIDNINLSVDAVTSQTYEKVRRGSTCVDLQGVTHNENRFDELTKKIEYWFKRNDHCCTRHEFVVSDYNRFEEQLFIDKWYPLLCKGDSIVTKDVLTYGGSIANDAFKPQGLCAMLDKNEFVVITWDGKVGPCYLDTNMSLRIGSVLDTDIKNIIDCENHIKIKELAKSKSIYPCKICDCENRIRKRIIKR